MVNSSPRYLLISPTQIGYAALLVNAPLACAMMAWNALWLERYGQALLCSLAGVGGVNLMNYWFSPNPLWLGIHLVAAMLVARYSRSQFAAAYYGHVYDRGALLPMAPFISILCAIQIIVLSSLLRSHGDLNVGASSRPLPAPIATATVNKKPRAAGAAESGRYRSGSQVVEYRDVSFDSVEALVELLNKTGLFDSGHSGWAGLDSLPEGVRVTLVLPPGATLTEQADSKYQQAADQLGQALDPTHRLCLSVYGQDKLLLKNYLAR